VEDSIVDYPPLYTLQPNLEIRGRQFLAWRQILADSKEFIFDVSSQILSNRKIDRKLNAAFFTALGDFLVKENSACWLTPERLLFLPLSLDAYGDALLAWAAKTGAGVETLFHIQQSALEGAPEDLVLAALRRLEARGKCKVLKEGQGVRFTFSGFVKLAINEIHTISLRCDRLGSRTRGMRRCL